MLPNDTAAADSIRRWENSGAALASASAVAPLTAETIARYLEGDDNENDL